MPATLRLLREEITYSQAKSKEVNIIHQLGYHAKQTEFFEHVQKRRAMIEAAVAYHLGLKPSLCHAADREEWMSGSFNLCVPVSVQGHRRVLMRFPLLHRIGDAFRPGNGDEKVRCEAGTYAWLQQECPTVPIPHLYGFALSTGQCFTALKHLPLFTRLFQRVRHWYLSFFSSVKLSNFVPRPNPDFKELGAYLLMNFVEGKPLATNWIEKWGDNTMRRNLVRGLSQVLLTLSRTPLPKIGSFVIDDNGFLHLINRPLTLMLQDLENEGIPVPIPKNQTFSSVDSYVNALLACHDSRLRYQPNGAVCSGDCVKQMTALAVMRMIALHHFDPSLNHGPFVFGLTDLYPQNIFVDQDWNITCILDLEWAASLPLEFMQVPAWLSAQTVDRIETNEFDTQRKDFMAVFEKEEEKLPAAEYGLRRASILNDSWKRGTFWYTLALGSPTGLHALFYKKIQPPYAEIDDEETAFFIAVCQYWTRKAPEFIGTKDHDKEVYDEKLRELFGIKSPTEDSPRE